ncbi:MULTISPECIES: mannose-1-phosphate guanylyltransferase/mannose-6-phosphate isomerase [Thalassospira]|uniref:mannose-1-phosphate guanylyltransferase n=1 Tax=Thalassospira profundimaris TaxID=502049 RepID=A0A367VMI1_9PROT|nr:MULTISPECIES: mannose-1-phosphate guanylyltransferase/mannose-6-phosphate isomerase [Thalassospira]RCK25470.1 mannose-1-phosphate guanyltransferase [Thalassospira profundimaris]
MREEKTIKPVIMCGGSGTRLWPLSRKAFPKQFIPLYDGKSLFELTLDRVSPLGDVLAVSGNDYRFFVQEIADKTGQDLIQILEPCGRDTAPAMGLAAAFEGGPDDLLLFCPADHFIPNANEFRAMVIGALDLASGGWIVTFGVQPSGPSTAYGYIETGEGIRGDAAKSVRFHEKPDCDTALKFLSSGKFLWNSGIFLIKRSVLLESIQAFEPTIYDKCIASIASAEQDGAFWRPGAEFVDATNKSIDYAVMERANNIAVVPFKGVWSDVGSWDAMFALSEVDQENCGKLGVTENIHSIDSKNTLVHASDRRLVVTIGTQDLAIIDTPDALMVSALDQVEKVKGVVSELDAAGRAEVQEHRRVARPWGAYDSIDHSDRFQVKRITVKPGARLSLQRHNHRAEHWIVVKGTALVTREDENFLLHENESTYIPLGAVHRMENPGKTPLELIEVQSGTYLGEDDIVRFDDQYGRETEKKEGN